MLKFVCMLRVFVYVYVACTYLCTAEFASCVVQKKYISKNLVNSCKYSNTFLVRCPKMTLRRRRRMLDGTHQKTNIPSLFPREMNSVPLCGPSACKNTYTYVFRDERCVFQFAPPDRSHFFFRSNKPRIGYLINHDYTYAMKTIDMIHSHDT